MEEALKDVPEGWEVEIVAVRSSEEQSYLPEFVRHSEILERDISAIVPGAPGLPILADVLKAGLSSQTADYVVFSNVDIAVMPYFYQAVSLIIEDGHEGFIINRRRVSKQHFEDTRLTQMYMQSGAIHSGYDCFVFKANDFPKFDLGEVCLGVPHVGNTLAHNLFAHSKGFKLFTGLHLTFHVGMELVKKWGTPELRAHNKREFRRVLRELKPHLRIENMPGAYEPVFRRHFKWLMNPTLHYPTVARMDLKSFKWRRKDPHLRQYERAGRYHEWLLKRVNFD